MELAMSGLFRVRWSNDIHREWMSNVVKKRPDLTLEDLESTRRSMDAAIPDGCVTGYESLIPALSLPDPNDRHVLAAAIRCGANAIVTFNERHFPPEAINEFGIHTRHPDIFIRNVDELDLGTLLTAARADIAHYKNPPPTTKEYIEDLRRAGLPMTADHLTNLRILIET